MRRRAFLAAATATLAAPRIGNAQAAKPLRFVPDADLAMIDPVVTTSYQTRDHGFMVYDTLYGQDDSYRVRPQMVAGHIVEDDGLTWTLTLRDGLPSTTASACWPATRWPRCSAGAGAMPSANR